MTYAIVAPIARAGICAAARARAAALTASDTTAAKRGPGTPLAIDRGLLVLAGTAATKAMIARVRVTADRASAVAVAVDAVIRAKTFEEAARLHTATSRHTAVGALPCTGHDGLHLACASTTAAGATLSLA